MRAKSSPPKRGRSIRSSTFGADEVIGWEPSAGYADAYLTLSAYARAARKAGATLREGVSVTGLLRDGARVTGVETTQGSVGAGLVVSAQNMWSRELAALALDRRATDAHAAQGDDARRRHTA